MLVVNPNLCFDRTLLGRRADRRDGVPAAPGRRVGGRQGRQRGPGAARPRWRGHPAGARPPAAGRTGSRAAARRGTVGGRGPRGRRRAQRRPSSSRTADAPRCSTSPAPSLDADDLDRLVAAVGSAAGHRAPGAGLLGQPAAGAAGRHLRAPGHDRQRARRVVSVVDAARDALAAVLAAGPTWSRPTWTRPRAWSPAVTSSRSPPMRRPPTIPRPGARGGRHAPRARRAAGPGHGRRARRGLRRRFGPAVARGPQADVANPIGAGDALVGGVLFALALIPTRPDPAGATRRGTGSRSPAPPSSTRSPAASTRRRARSLAANGSGRERGDQAAHGARRRGRGRREHQVRLPGGQRRRRTSAPACGVRVEAAVEELNYVPNSLGPLAQGRHRRHRRGGHRHHRRPVLRRADQRGGDAAPWRPGSTSCSAAPVSTRNASAARSSGWPCSRYARCCWPPSRRPRVPAPYRALDPRSCSSTARSRLPATTPCWSTTAPPPGTRSSTCCGTATGGSRSSARTPRFPTATRAAGRLPRRPGRRGDRADPGLGAARTADDRRRRGRRSGAARRRPDPLTGVFAANPRAGMRSGPRAAHHRPHRVALVSFGDFPLARRCARR